MWWNVRAQPMPSMKQRGWSTAAAASALAAFPHEPAQVDVAHIVRNNIYLYGIRGEGKSATHRAEAFMAQRNGSTRPRFIPIPSRCRTCRRRCATPASGVEDAIKVVVKTHGYAALAKDAAE